MKASIRPRVTERQRDAIKKLAHEQTVKEIGGITRRNYKLIMIALNESFGFGAGRLSRRGKDG